MQVTFIGTADGHTSRARQHSGILIQTHESSLLLDCGANVSQFLLSQNLPAEIPDALWISHLHSDHVSQFSSLIQSLWLRGRHSPLHVFAPSKAVPILQRWLTSCLLFPELIGFVLHWHPVKSGKAIPLPPFTFYPFATRHLKSLSDYFAQHYPNTCFDCLGVVFTHEKKNYIYSADLAHPEDLKPALRKKVVALFCELTHFPERDLFTALAGSSVEQLWITHYPDRLTGKNSILRKIASECKFKGTLRLMTDGTTQNL